MPSLRQRDPPSLSHEVLPCSPVYPLRGHTEKAQRLLCSSVVLETPSRSTNTVREQDSHGEEDRSEKVHAMTRTRGLKTGGTEAEEVGKS